MLKEIISFSKEFLDYYDLKDLTMSNSSNRFTDKNYTQHLIHIIDNSPGTEKWRDFLDNFNLKQKSIRLAKQPSK